MKVFFLISWLVVSRSHLFIYLFPSVTPMTPGVQLCWGFPRQPPGSMIWLDYSQTSVYGLTHSYDLLQQKIQGKISKGKKVAWGPNLKGIWQIFQEFSPSGVTKNELNLISPASNCDNTCEVLSSGKVHQRLSVQEFQ